MVEPAKIIRVPLECALGDAYRGALAVIGNVAAACKLSDISMGGALIEGNLPLEKGDTFQLCILDLPEITAKAMHCGNGFYGVQFQNTARFRNAIGIWIRRRMHGR